MKSENDSYTVVVLPDPTAKPYRFQIRKKSLKIALGALSVAAVVLAGILVHYVVLTFGVAELKGLRRETAIQKEQIQNFAAQLIDLKGQMSRIKEMDAKLRVITDIGPPSNSESSLGMGGPETSGLFETDLGNRTEDLARKMDEEVKALKTEASDREVSLEELSQSIKGKKVVWDSTPSIWPVRGWFSSGFGKRISPFTGRLTMHKGIDIATRQGTEIIAPAAGVVTYKGFDSGFGRVLKIDHGYGIQTLYGHLSKADVKIGQKVKRGDVIANVGNTGMSTGPHLHYQVFINGLPVNPLRYIIN
jgi:murein DD-endopeptidase MepM/ murein hydrolase activator NlpD